VTVLRHFAAFVLPLLALACAACAVLLGAMATEDAVIVSRRDRISAAFYALLMLLGVAMFGAAWWGLVS
jgi:hypothetical protein